MALTPSPVCEGWEGGWFWSEVGWAFSPTSMIVGVETPTYLT